ncbi:MAG: hypothetical protein WKF56_06230 [Candidatus Limnocylindrales bacterium]
MMASLRTGRDPWEGAAARRTRRLQRVKGGFALLLAVAACGLTSAMWLVELAPQTARLVLG